MMVMGASARPTFRSGAVEVVAAIAGVTPFNENDATASAPRMTAARVFLGAELQAPGSDCFNAIPLCRSTGQHRQTRPVWVSWERVGPRTTASGGTLF